MLIEIDVEIRWEHILHEDTSKVYIFEMEMDDDEENEEDPGKPDSEATTQFAKHFGGKQSLGKIVDKMDVLMELKLNHLNICAHEGRLPQLKLLIDDLKQRFLIEALPLKEIIEHKLNPLKVCLPSVVEECLRQIKSLHLFDVSQFITANNMLETNESKAFRGVERLDMFFPFDPYLLKEFDRFVKPNFTFWSMVSTSVEEDEFEDHMIDEIVIDPWDED
ncbi:hypothetical protein KI387_033130 [Taxus chinensis]|uniref:Uncharacterized protein n=1 Tax=Taxus chinensis TaxID=29808 RepID=A0AA38F451_TAXCH|nr:hypothetical protein KI387_033130 [Taxus chinensis]